MFSKIIQAVRPKKKSGLKYYINKNTKSSTLKRKVPAFHLTVYKPSNIFKLTLSSQWSNQLMLSFIDTRGELNDAIEKNLFQAIMLHDGLKKEEITAVIKQLRSNRDVKKIKIILEVSKITREEMLHFLKLGINSLVVEPVTLNTLEKELGLV